MWVTVTDEPGDYTSYIITIDSVTLTAQHRGGGDRGRRPPRSSNFAQLSNIAEMWGSGAVPVGTYVSATITLDYTNAAITVMRKRRAGRRPSSWMRLPAGLRPPIRSR